MAAKDTLDAVLRLAISETLPVKPQVRQRSRSLVAAWAQATKLQAFQEALAELRSEPDGRGWGDSDHFSAETQAPADWRLDEHEELLRPRERRAQAADGRDGAVSPPHIGTGLVRSPSLGGPPRISTSPDPVPPEPEPPAPAKLPFAAADEEEESLLQALLASNLREEAEALFEEEHFEAAGRVFSQALLYAPQERALLAGRAECLLRQGCAAEAAEDARRLRAWAPGWHVGAALAARASAAEGDAAAALREWEAAEELLAAEGGGREAGEYRRQVVALRTKLGA
jgi:tetratricopeptide (TPR) repeat protein